MKILYRLMPPLIIALALDGLSKLWAEKMLDPHLPVPVVGELFRFTLGYNSGVAFGLFANGGKWPLFVTGIVIVGLMIWLTNALRAGEFPPQARWPIGFLLGGAIANFADRLPDGRVTDFLDAGIGAARWPTFNLADSFIVLSLAVLLLMNLKPTGLDGPDHTDLPDPPLSEPGSS